MRARLARLVRLVGIGALVTIFWPFVTCGECGRLVFGPRYGAHLREHTRALLRGFGMVAGQMAGRDTPNAR